MAKMAIKQRSGETNLIKNFGAVENEKSETGYEIDIKSVKQLTDMAKAGTISINPRGIIEFVTN
jgi:hypothetical protein